MTIDPLKAGLHASLGVLLACSGSDRQAPDPTELVIAKPAANSGDAQVGVAGAPLPDSLRVLITRRDEPAEGVTVIWSTPEGSVNPRTTRTDARGMAATTWTTLPLFAEQVAMARLDGGQSVLFTAIATPDPGAPGTIRVLSEGGNRFEPADFTVQVGVTVKWFWVPGSTGHNIVPDDGDSPPQSGALADWPKWHVFRFTKPGVYRYHCAAHGGAAGVGMSGTITVESSVDE